MGICEKHEKNPDQTESFTSCDDCTCDVCGGPLHLCKCMEAGILD